MKRHRASGQLRKGDHPGRQPEKGGGRAEKWREEGSGVTKRGWGESVRVGGGEGGRARSSREGGRFRGGRREKKRVENWERGM